MAPRKKPPEQPALPVAAARPLPAAAAESTEIPKTLEYQPAIAGVAPSPWQVEKFDLLAVFFGFPGTDWKAAMARFHEYAEGESAREGHHRWFYVRRLYGVAPLIPGAAAQADDLRVWSREELAAATGLKPEQLSEELTRLRVGWEAWQGNQEREQAAGSPPPPATGGRLQLGDELLERFNFDKTMFDVEVYVRLDDGTGEFGYRRRPAAKTRAEMDWFLAKLARPEWQKMLEEPMAGSLARQALVNELYLRRFDAEMLTMMPNSPRWKELATSRGQIEKTYQSQMGELQEKFPELAVAGRVSFRAVIGDLNLAHRQYYGAKDRRLWDKVHTAAELVFLTRTSAQQPVPRYRMGWAVAVVEAMHGLYDPNFRSQLKRSDLRKLDRGFQRGVEEAKREMGEKEVDLEKGVIPGEPETDEFADYLVGEKKETP